MPALRLISSWDRRLTREMRAPAKHGQELCRHNFASGRRWQGKPYVIKQVAPVIVEKANEIVVIGRTARLSEEVALNIGEGEKLAGIGILDTKSILGPAKIPAVTLEGIESITGPLALHDKPAKPK